ncbi:Hypothetical protein MCB1EB_1479 [Mycoavidus cysteinexigens]|uniref:Uncharacterized protein n=1 Tax=Mycoavidus cysteinexigens TaxID=1553431 RepID=A0A2Z6EVZ9_9BURK|nr:hypothetical protein [Mycoavidus cysteinexigens]BBE09640.1 Hypothetical protein MCB1EB_1479 [Mycoavidus cysteinexigens]GAM51609.1 hypothetical protein EBME_0072 [bacterium endosymbiont of Mortierella elongata FMR23-6]GLR01770.1 hypothetical protein GCM10007934_15820 [Mycoavidus cysteinexigens]
MKRFENDNALLRAAIWANRIEVLIKASTTLAAIAAFLTGTLVIFINWSYV